MALCLSTQPGKTLLLCLPDGQTIKVLIVKSSRGRVRLQIDAPPAVRIVRGEIDREAVTD